jgi:hypothetical protein
VLDESHDVHALADVTKHRVLSVEEAGLHSANEKLRAVGVWAGIGHRQDAGSRVLQSEVFVRKLVSVD